MDMPEDKWGFGNGKETPFCTSVLGNATKGRDIELYFGEHPHSRRDNNIYAKLNGGEPVGFDGHRQLIDVHIECSNYLKESEYSGDEIRKGGSARIVANGVTVYEFFFRDPQWALIEAHKLITTLGEHASGWMSASERAALIGRKVWYRDTPAVIERLIVDQGCLILKPDGPSKFEPAAWQKADRDIDPDDDDYIKTSVTDPNIWWFRGKD